MTSRNETHVTLLGACGDDFEALAKHLAVIDHRNEIFLLDTGAAAKELWKSLDERWSLEDTARAMLMNSAEPLQTAAKVAHLRVRLRQLSHLDSETCKSVVMLRDRVALLTADASIIDDDDRESFSIIVTPGAATSVSRDGRRIDLTIGPLAERGRVDLHLGERGSVRIEVFDGSGEPVTSESVAREAPRLSILP